MVVLGLFSIFLLGDVFYRCSLVGEMFGKEPNNEVSGKLNEFKDCHEREANPETQDTSKVRQVAPSLKKLLILQLKI